MNKEEKFIEYLINLKNVGNAELLESVISGFKTLVEYRVGGSVSERQVDIMESEEDMVDDIMVDDSEYSEENMIGDLDTPIDESSHTVEKLEDGTLLSDSTDGTSEETNSMMEVGEGEVKGKLTPAILRQIDDEIEASIHKIASMIDRQKLVTSDDQKVKYLNHMRSEKWRDNLLSRDIDPSSVKGLIPAVTESIEEADSALLESVNLMKMVVDK